MKQYVFNTIEEVKKEIDKLKKETDDILPIKIRQKLNRRKNEI